MDGVIVASPHTLHYEHARVVLERGLHVMCEKSWKLSDRFWLKAGTQVERNADGSFKKFVRIK